MSSSVVRPRIRTLPTGSSFKILLSDVEEIGRVPGICKKKSG